MTDIAAAAGVHPSTVSLVMRNSPTIPAATAIRIHDVAERLGYKPDPHLAAFNFQRLRNRAPKHGHTIALITESNPVHDPWVERYYFPLAKKAAARMCDELGFAFEHFQLGSGGLTPRQLDRILGARGIRGAVFFLQDLKRRRLELNWAGLSPLKIESFQLEQGIDTITADHQLAVRIGFNRLRKLGYRRCGMLLCPDVDERLSRPYWSSYMIEQRKIPEAERVPYLEHHSRDSLKIAGPLREWCLRERVDAILLSCAESESQVTAAFEDPGECPAVVALDWRPGFPHLAGIVQNHEIIAQRAVEAVSMMIVAHQRGIPRSPSVALVPGFWRDGVSAPRRSGLIMK